jgi:DNA-directed RNA polymerase specialized sigma24 family protein
MARAADQLNDPATPFYRRRRLTADAVAHAFVRAQEVWANAPDYFQSLEHLVRWLRLVAYRAMVTWHRSGAGSSPESLSVEDWGKVRDPRPDRAGGGRWTDDDREAVREALQYLSAEERAVLVGRYFEGRTDAEVAERLFPGLSAVAGKLRVWRIRQRAQSRLGRLLRRNGVGSGGPVVAGPLFC